MSIYTYQGRYIPSFDPTGHDALFQQVIGPSAAAMASVTVDPNEYCEPLLRKAFELVEHLEELSFGLWKIRHDSTTKNDWRKREKYSYRDKSAIVLVALKSEFLEKMGISVDPKLFGGGITRSQTPLRLMFGCNECAHSFVYYCRKRWFPESLVMAEKLNLRSFSLITFAPGEV